MGGGFLRVGGRRSRCFLRVDPGVGFLMQSLGFRRSALSLDALLRQFGMQESLAAAAKTGALKPSELTAAATAIYQTLKDAPAQKSFTMLDSAPISSPRVRRSRSGPCPHRGSAPRSPPAAASE